MGLLIFDAQGKFRGWHPDENDDPERVIGEPGAVGVAGDPIDADRAAVSLDAQGAVVVDADISDGARALRDATELSPQQVRALLLATLQLVVRISDGSPALGGADQRFVDFLKVDLLPVLGGPNAQGLRALKAQIDAATAARERGE